MNTAVRRTAACVAGVLLGWSGVGRAGAHPLHTTITELVFSGTTVRVTIRAYVDDFGRSVHGIAAGAAAPAQVADSAAAFYVRSHFALAGADGRPVALRWCGMERREGVYLICLAGAIGRMEGAMVHNRMHWELYPDQINIVQASYSGRRESLLFVKDDPPRRLPPA